MQIFYTPTFQGKLPREVLEKYIAEKVSVSDIAKRENLGIPYVSRRFKAEGLQPINKHTQNNQKLTASIQELLFKGLSATFIATFLGCSRDTVYRIKSKCKLIKRDPTLEQIKRMLDSGCSSKEIREKLGITLKELSNYISNNKLKSPQRIKREKIIEMFKKGYSDEQIAKKFNDSIIAIETRRKRYNQAIGNAMHDKKQS